MLRDQVDFYQRGSEVSRYHTVHTLQRETVGHHSHGVVVLCKILCPDASADLLWTAAIHDLAEHHTGDIPSPSKRKYGIGQQVSELEDQLLDAAGLTMPNLTEQEKRILKLADIAQGALFCSREIGLGNIRLKEVFDRYMSYAEDMILIGKERELFNFIAEKRYHG
jgi:5'-deoxynucleotidase YfbR-like HD superfamily hydrolase